MTEVTIQNTMKELRDVPELKEIARYLIYQGNADAMPEEAPDMENLPIVGTKEIGWNPDRIAGSTNFLIRQFACGMAKPYFLYSEAECADDPQKQHVNIVRLLPEHPDPAKPWILLAAGGAYMSVCSAVEAYPAAEHMIKRGYQVFVLTYRVGEFGILPKPLDDLATAIRFIRSHAEEFGLNPDRYAVGGFSAGANLISNWGTTNVGYKKYNLPKPAALFPIYTVVDLKTMYQEDPANGFLIIMLGEGYSEEKLASYNVEQNVNAEYPPCYIVCGKDDATVPCANSELLKKRLDEYGVPAVLDEGEHAQHGFGDGTGTDVEGWPERALDFMESLS